MKYVYQDFDLETKVHRSTYRPLTLDGKVDKDWLDTQEQFITRVVEKLTFQTLPRELEETGLENILQYDAYEDETQNKQLLPELAEDLESMP